MDSVAYRRLLASCAVENKPNPMCKYYLFVLLVSKTNTILHEACLISSKQDITFMNKLSVLLYREPVSTRLPQTIVTENNEKEVVGIIKNEETNVTNYLI
uniref:Uncharacterized protein n=1 Tax=Glossina palpalis gambiensis TaxID=67801 RepID=A0A1B0BTG4_9MUSC